MAKRPTPSAAGPAPAAASPAPDAAAQAEADRVAAEQAEADRVAAEKAESELAEHGGFDMAGRTILVRSISRLGRRRGGIAFGVDAVSVAVDDLTEDQLAAILGDSDHLVVQLEA